MIIKSQQTKPATCPTCGKVLDGVTGEGDPVPGCVSVCSYCCGLAVFTEDLDLRKFKPGEYEKLPPHHRQRLELLRSDIHQANENQRVIDRMVFVEDEQVDPRYARLLESGDAALAGPLCSEGPPPRRWRPAKKGRCSKCRREIWLSSHGPQRARLRLCVECGIQVIRASDRADS